MVSPCVPPPPKQSFLAFLLLAAGARRDERVKKREREVRLLNIQQCREYKAFAPITGYSYGFWFQNGSINTEAVKVNSRTYAQAIAGESQSMTFNAFTYVFQLVYQLHKNCTLPTEIYIHKKMLYPRGTHFPFPRPPKPTPCFDWLIA